MQNKFYFYQERLMAKAYFVSTYHEIYDEDKLAAYAALAGPALTSQGGRILARGIADIAKEHGKKMRTVILEFDSVEIAEAAYNSDAYKQALDALGDGVKRDIRIIAGV